MGIDWLFMLLPLAESQDTSRGTDPYGLGGGVKAATASARVQPVRYSYSPSMSLPV